VQRLLFKADRVLLGVSIVLLTGFSCTQDKTVWVAFNADSDAVTVEVTASEVGAAVATDLHSTTGASVVGSASVDPGSGPVGTTHRVEVHVDTDFVDRVGKVEVLADSGDRGSRTFSLLQDSADTGLWVVDVSSHGSSGEVRSDTFTFELYEEVPASEETDSQ
jgi:hypothetical protein